MAKKRVHELAKLYDLPSAEVLKRLTAAGIETEGLRSGLTVRGGDPAEIGRLALAAGVPLRDERRGWRVEVVMPPG